MSENGDSLEPVKQCRRCKEGKPLSEFGAFKNSLDGHRGYCKICLRAMDAEYRSKQAYKENKKKYSALWRRENAEHRREYKINLLAIKKDAGDEEWLKRTREKAQERNRRYYDTHKAKCFDHAARRRARMTGAFQEKVDRLAIYERDNGICWICKLPVPLIRFSLDHVIPIVKGGPHCVSNVRVAHIACNISKGSRILDESTPVGVSHAE